VECFVLRLWDGMDGVWIDVTGPIPYADCQTVYNEKTANGTVKTTFQDIDYYRIFPADTIMEYSGDNVMLR
jgi:hypothetical protein